MSPLQQLLSDVDALRIRLPSQRKRLHQPHVINAAVDPHSFMQQNHALAQNWLQLQRCSAFSLDHVRLQPGNL